MQVNLQKVAAMNCIIDFYRANLKPLVAQYAPDDSEVSSTLYMTGAAAIIVTAIIWRSLGISSSKRIKRQQVKKKDSKHKKDVKLEPLTFEKKIDNVRLRFNKEYKPGIDQLLENYDPADKDKVYQRNFYNEMLLKLLIELDGVELVEVQGERKIALKEQRKGVIREIQTHLKTLDKLI